MSESICGNCLFSCKESNKTVCDQYAEGYGKDDPTAEVFKRMSEQGLKGAESGKFLRDVVNILQPELTKREHFAFGIFKKIWDGCEKDPEPYDPNNTMQMRAVLQADELIKALNEEK